MGLASWENGCTVLLFLNVAFILGRVKSSIPHGAWRFHFFPNLKNKIKIRVHQHLHIHH
jgi:hypothetical protein